LVQPLGVDNTAARVRGSISGLSEKSNMGVVAADDGDGRSSSGMPAMLGASADSGAVSSLQKSQSDFCITQDFKEGRRRPFC